MPCISISIGKAMRDSTSVGASPGALTITCTCGGEMSGKASMGSVRNAHRPPATAATATINIISRWISANRMSAAIMADTPFRP